MCICLFHANKFYLILSYLILSCVDSNTLDKRKKQHNAKSPTTPQINANTTPKRPPANNQTRRDNPVFKITPRKRDHSYMIVKSPRFLSQKIKNMQLHVERLQEQLTNSRKISNRKNILIAQHRGEIKKLKASYAILKSKFHKYSSKC